jgi:large subunit ribosomal protein L25
MMQPNVLMRFAARNLQRYPTKCRSAGFSSITAAGDPSRLVSGLTQEQVDANPEIAQYLRANFGNRNKESITVSNGITVPAEVLREFGVTGEDLAESTTTKKSGKTAKQYGDPSVDAGLGTEEQQALNIRVLRTYLREEEGTKPSNRLRNHHNLIPGILYGGDPASNISSLEASSKSLLKTPWAELQRELDRFHRRFESRVYDLTVYEGEDDTEGTTHRVIPRNVQRHPVQGKIYCANFLRYHAGRPIKIPLQLINQEESPALKRDGFIIPVMKHVECFVQEGVRIPDALEVECTGLVLKDIIRMDRVIFPDGVRPTDRVDVENFVVGPVRGGRSAGMADEENGEGAAGKEDD